MKYQTIRLSAVLSGATLLSACALMPDPITDEERQEQIAADTKLIFTEEKKVTKPITLYEAMARSLKHNLEHRVKMMEQAVADGQSDVTNFSLLPDLIASAGYKGRDSFNASSSRSIETGTESLVTSTAQDKSRRTYDLIFSWNILDFGVSFFQARQDANRVLISEESRRKTAQLLMQEVRTAFWRTASTQQVQEQLKGVLKDARTALADTRAVEEEKLEKPLDILNYQKNLLRIIRNLENLDATLKLAKIELASLMGLKPGEEFTLDVPETNLDEIEKLPLKIKQMENMSLQLRPELREEMYQDRITAEETYKAILRLLPGVEFNLGYNYDSNSFTLNHNWFEWTGLITKNVIELLAAPAHFSHLDAQEELGKARRLSVYLAILTQVHLAYSQYILSQDQFKHAKDINHVNQKIFQQTKKLQEGDASTEVNLVKARTDALMSHLQLHEAYAEIQSALGRVYVSLGLDPLPQWIESHSIEALAKSIADLDKKWQDGSFKGPEKSKNDEEDADDENEKTDADADESTDSKSETQAKGEEQDKEKVSDDETSDVEKSESSDKVAETAEVSEKAVETASDEAVAEVADSADETAEVSEKAAETASDEAVAEVADETAKVSEEAAETASDEAMAEVADSAAETAEVSEKAVETASDEAMAEVADSADETAKVSEEAAETASDEAMAELADSAAETAEVSEKAVEIASDEAVDEVADSTAEIVEAAEKAAETTGEEAVAKMAETAEIAEKSVETAEDEAVAEVTESAGEKTEAAEKVAKTAVDESNAETETLFLGTENNLESVIDSSTSLEEFSSEDGVDITSFIKLSHDGEIIRQPVNRENVGTAVDEHSQEVLNVDDTLQPEETVYEIEDRFRGTVDDSSAIEYSPQTLTD